MRDGLDAAGFQGHGAGERVHATTGHGANVRGRGAKAAAKNAYTSGGSFAREKSEIFRRGFWIDDAVSFALGQTGVGHAADAKIVNRSKLLEDGKKRLRTDGAVCSDDLNVFIFELRRGIGRSQIAIGSAIFGVGELCDDGQQREGT